uniref:Uncharacterized protein n=1 Tax=Mus musculus TaxID=10090 RepID=Q3UR60_MOUSE|nr:unnamed protein product [Mus musculus]
MAGWSTQTPYRRKCFPFNFSLCPFYRWFKSNENAPPLSAPCRSFETEPRIRTLANQTSGETTGTSLHTYYHSFIIVVIAIVKMEPRSSKMISTASSTELYPGA